MIAMGAVPSSNSSEVTGGYERILYARDTDGSFPVYEYTNEYRVHKPSGVQSFKTKRQLLIALTGHPKARNWTFDRYFKTPTSNEDALAGEPLLTTLELFAAPEPQPEPEVKLGIDLVNRGHEVAKLLYAGFGPWMRTYSYDPEEVLQEVYAGILVRNKGKCPWDIRKSSFGHYVHMVCNSILSNYHRKQKRIRECEQVGIRSFDENGDWKEDDVSKANVPAKVDSDLFTYELYEVAEDLKHFIPYDPTTHLVHQVLPYVRDGYSKVEIARELGESRNLIGRALTELREWATKWMTPSRAINSPSPTQGI